MQPVITKDNRKKNVKPEKRVDWKQQYRIDPTDGLLRTSIADYDLFPNIKKLLVIDCISPIESVEGDSSVLCF